MAAGPCEQLLDGFIASYLAQQLPLLLFQLCLGLHVLCHKMPDTHHGKVVLLVFLDYQITRFQFISYNTILQTRPDRFPDRSHTGMW